MKTHLILALSCLCSSVIATTGCAVDGNAENQGVGTMRMPLRAVSADGTEYRLRQATFEITGPESESVLSEDHLTQGVAQVVLGVGNYQVELTGSWQMERIVDGIPESVDAVLVSQNPVAFAIEDQGVAAVTFRFEVDGEVIETGEGVLELRIEVEETGDDPGPDPGPDPGTLLWSSAGPGQLPIVAAGLAGDRVAVTSGPAVRFAVDESGLVWQSAAQRPSPLGQTIVAGGVDEVLAATNSGQLSIESFSAINGGGVNYVATPPNNGSTSLPRLAAVPGGGAVYSVGNPGNGVIGRLGPNGIQMWMSPGPAAGFPRDLEVTQTGVLALFAATNGGQASLSALDLNGSVRSITFFPVAGGGQAYSLRSESPALAFAFVGQGPQAIVYRLDPISGAVIGSSTILASFAAPVVDIEPGADNLLAVATRDAVLHVLDASGTERYAVSVAGGDIQDVVFLPDSNAVCAIASSGTQSRTSCYAN